MVDGDSQRATPMREMSVMILEEDDALRLRKAMNLHSMKLTAPDTPKASRRGVAPAADNGMQQQRAEPPPPRTLAILGKRRRSEVATQVLVALHRQAETLQHISLHRTTSAAGASGTPLRLRIFDGHERGGGEYCIADVTKAEAVPQATQKRENVCVENGDEEGMCRTPTQTRRQQNMVCPEPPRKPASKPKRTHIINPPCNKKFFVPNNLADLPPSFKSLFT